MDSALKGGKKNGSQKDRQPGWGAEGIKKMQAPKKKDGKRENITMRTIRNAMMKKTRRVHNG